MNDIARVFNLALLGIDVSLWAAQIRPAFLRLPSDEYELRGRQLAVLREALENQCTGKAKASDSGLKDFLKGGCTLETLPVFCTLDSEVQQRLLMMQYRRKRAVATFFLSEEGPCDEHAASTDGNAALLKWRVERSPSGYFVQYNSAFYPDQRQFHEMEDEVVQDPSFQKILRFLPQLVRDAGEPASELKIVCHQVASFATPDTPGHGAPEGIHQDGADFIVSALVLHRENVDGGVSRVYRKKEEGGYELVFTHTLQAGEGIFQADENTNIWHDVTPVTLVNGTASGLRTTFGFDIHVLSGVKN